MAKSLIDLIDFKVTLPLSEKTKNIHTNSWIYFEPLPFMEDVERIYKEMGKNKSTRWVAYRKGYWYVKAVKINYTKDKQTMELTLSPFPTIFNAQDLEKKATTTSSTSNNSNKTSTNSLTIKAPDWLNKTDKEWAEKFVKKAIQGTNDKLKRAKRIYSAFKDGYKYCGYSDLKYTTPQGNRKKAFNRGCGNCADGANILETLMLTGRINARIKHAPNHYIVKLKIDGKTYWVDNHGTKSWNKVWRGKTSNSEANISNGEWING